MQNKQQQWVIPALAGLFGVGVVVILAMTVFNKGSVPVSAPPPGSASSRPRMTPDQSRQIDVLRKVVAGDPNNLQAWVQLGNLYFDTGNPAESAKAYDEALRINPSDADVITDQGVMFREMGQFQRAVENFRRAASVNPNHTTSQFNIGVVLFYDLHDLRGAKTAFERYMAMAEGHSGEGDRVAQTRQTLIQIDQELAAGR